jgi:hypothetical protein
VIAKTFTPENGGEVFAITESPRLGGRRGGGAIMSG